MLQSHMQCRLYACGTKREPSSPSVPSHLETAEIHDSPITLGQESSLTTSNPGKSSGSASSLPHNRNEPINNAYACIIKACNINSTEYDDNIIPHNANINEYHMITT